MTKGLKVFTSNRLELLVDELAGVCSVQLGSVFRPETVVVQSQGMSRWLSLQLADRNLICANYRFPFPNAFAHQLFKVLSADLPREPECQLDVLIWRVMHHLPTRLREESFSDLKNYLGGQQLTPLLTHCRSVLFNFLGRDFFNALSEKDVETFSGMIVKWLCALVVGIPVFVMRDYFQSRCAPALMVFRCVAWCFLRHVRLTRQGSACCTVLHLQMHGVWCAVAVVH